MDTPLKANIGPKVKSRLERSPQGDDGTYLFKNVIITHFWQLASDASKKLVTTPLKSEGMVQ